MSSTTKKGIFKPVGVVTVRWLIRHVFHFTMQRRGAPPYEFLLFFSRSKKRTRGNDNDSYVVYGDIDTNTLSLYSGWRTLRLSLLSTPSSISGIISRTTFWGRPQLSQRNGRLPGTSIVTLPASQPAARAGWKPRWKKERKNISTVYVYGVSCEQILLRAKKILL